MSGERYSDKELFEHVYPDNSYDDLPLVTRGVFHAHFNEPKGVTRMERLMDKKAMKVIRLNYPRMDKYVVHRTLGGAEITCINPHELTINGTPLQYLDVIRENETLGGVAEDYIEERYDSNKVHLFYLIGVLSESGLPVALLSLAPPLEPIQRPVMLHVPRRELAWGGAI